VINGRFKRRRDVLMTVKKEKNLAGLKLLGLLLAIVLVLGVAGCGGGSDKTGNSSDKTSTSNEAQKPIELKDRKSVV
jgi:uncharacterized protein HemX